MNKNERGKYLLKNTFIFAIGSFATKLIAFFFVPLYTHILEAEEFGIVDLVITVSTIIASVLTLNISEAVMRFALDKGADKRKILTIGINILIIATVLGLFIIPIVKRIEMLSEYALYFYLYSLTLGYSTVFLSYLRGCEKLVEYSVGNIIHSLAIAILNVLFLLVWKMGVTGYFYAYIISNVITTGYAFVVGGVHREIRHFNMDMALCKQMLKFSVVLIPNSFMWWIMNSADRVMVTAYLGAAASGIYAVSYKIPTLLTMVSSVFTQAWNYSAIKEKDSSDNEEYTNNVYNSLFGLLVIAAAGMMMLIKPFLKIYVENSYYTAWEYTPYLIIGFIFMTLGTFLSSSYTVHKDSKGFLFSATVGAIVSVLLKVIFIPLIGVSGAALSTCISYMAVFVYRVIDTRKYLKMNVFRVKHIIAYIMLIVLAITMFIDNFVGQILLVVEFFVVLTLFRNSIIVMVKPVISKLLSKKEI